MAEVTVSELAKSVGAPVERILTQMQQAGLKHTTADDLVSDDEKQKLLVFLKASHGETAEATPKKITLKRKTTTTLKTGSGSSRKTVNVEVRKKRTYVKRDEAPTEAEETPVVDVAELPETPAETKPVEPEVVETPDVVEPVAQVPEVEPEPKEEPAAEEAPEKGEAPKVDDKVVEPVSEVTVASEPEKAVEEAPKVKPTQIRTSFVDDVEEMRIRAAQKRKNAEAERIAASAAAKKEKEDAAAAKKEAQAKLAQKPAAKAAPKTEKPARPALDTLKKAPRDADKAFEDDDKKHNKRAGKAVKKTAGPKKVASALDYVEDKAEIDEVIRVPKSKKLGSGKKGSRPVIKKSSNKHGFKKPTEKITYEVAIGETIIVSDLAQQMNVKAGEVIKTLMKMGTMSTMNQAIDQETAQLVVEELGHTFRLVSKDEIENKLKATVATKTEGGKEISRAPIITVMGHVDHGKTSLLDYIREAKVASGEAGGITQHIGAYRVQTGHGELTFLDTPGHAAFTAMRARGAQATDVIILVVAADDGVMPQTEEAVQHAKAAGVPMVVAINKMDKEAADPDRVKNELSAKDVIPEDWGGDTQFIPVSAHTGEGIDELLEAVALQSELLELKALTEVPAKGVVIESRMDKGRGVVATVLVQDGNLHAGNIILAGQSFGRVRAMTNELGKSVRDAGPSTPVEILGLDATPNAGDEFLVVPDERKAREVSEFRAERERQEKLQRQQAAKLENMFAGIGENEVKTLSVVLKTDVRGSLEAIQAALLDMGNDEVQVNIVGGGVGGITGNDVNLALTTGAIVLGFNVRADATARKVAESESIEIRYYSIIYQLIDEVKSALSGMLDPERIEEIVGIAEVRDTFRSPKFGQVAGCMVTEGTVYRNKPIRVLRDNVVIFEGELESLRRFKDDVSDVRNGMECGIGVKNYDVKVGDQIEVFEVKEVAREL